MAKISLCFLHNLVKAHWYQVTWYQHSSRPGHSINSATSHPTRIIRTSYTKAISGIQKLTHWRIQIPFPPWPPLEPPPWYLHVALRPTPEPLQLSQCTNLDWLAYPRTWMSTRECSRRLAGHRCRGRSRLRVRRGASATIMRMSLRWKRSRGRRVSGM